MKKEFIVERNGRSFVLYAGLLDLAHERGLRSITTTLVQVPSELNGTMAICHATVETEQGTFTGLGDASPENVSRMMLPHLIRMAETRAKARALRDAVNVGVTALEELGELDEADEHGGPAAPSAGGPAGAVVNGAARARRGLRPLEPAEVAEAEHGDETRDYLAALDAEHEPAALRASARAVAGVASRNGAGAAGGPGSNGHGSSVRPGASPATPKQLQTIARMARAAGKTIDAEGLTRAQASEIISSLIGEMDHLRAS